MEAIYAFCREVDDVADEAGDAQIQLRGLPNWRARVERLYAGEPTLLTTRALQGPTEAFGLPHEEFLAVIDGVEMDPGSTLCVPP